MPRTSVCSPLASDPAYAACGAGLIAARGTGASAGADARQGRRASKIDTEGGLLGQMIALMLERQGIPVENRVQLGPTKVVRTAHPFRRDRHLSGIYRQRRLLPRHGERPRLEGGAPAFETAKRLDAREEQARLARSGAGQQHLAHRRTRRPRPARKARDDGGFREAFAERLASSSSPGSAEFVESAAGAAVLRAGLQFQAAPRSDRRPARRRHRRHHARRSPERERRQCRHGLRHGRGDRGARPRRHGGHQGRADRLRAGARHPCRRAAALSGNRAGPRAGLRLALDEQAPGAQRADRRRRAAGAGQSPSATSSKKVSCAEFSRVVSHRPVAAPRVADTAVDLFAAGSRARSRAPCVRRLRPRLARVAPNRLLPGQPVRAVQALGLDRARRHRALLVLRRSPRSKPLRARRLRRSSLVAALALALWATGSGRRRAPRRSAPRSARAMLGAGFWLACAALVGLAVRACGATRGRASGAGRRGTAARPSSQRASLRTLRHLSLVVEYQARDGERPCRALEQHVVLSLGALASRSLSPFRSAGPRSARSESRRSSNAVLGAIQVTPALALFGLLIPLLAGLLAACPGLREPRALGAIGPAPALIGVAIYLALPLLRGLVSGLRAADPAVVEAAQAMGMTEARMTCGGAHSPRAADPRRSACASPPSRASAS